MTCIPQWKIDRTWDTLDHNLQFSPTPAMLSHPLFPRHLDLFLKDNIASLNSQATLTYSKPLYIKPLDEGHTIAPCRWLSNADRRYSVFGPCISQPKPIVLSAVRFINEWIIEMVSIIPEWWDEAQHFDIDTYKSRMASFLHEAGY